MDNSGNGFNKLVVLLAVGVLGIVAGQYLFKPAVPSAPPGPWGAGYPIPQSQFGYAPSGTSPAGYPMPLPPATPMTPHGVPWPGSQTAGGAIPQANTSVPRPLAVPGAEAAEQSTAGRITGSLEPAPVRLVASPIPSEVSREPVVPVSGLSAAVPLASAILAAGPPPPTVTLLSIKDADLTWKDDNVPLTDREFQVELRFSDANPGDEVVDFCSGFSDDSVTVAVATLVDGNKKKAERSPSP